MKLFTYISVLSNIKEVRGYMLWKQVLHQQCVNLGDFLCLFFLFFTLLQIN